MYFLDTTLRSAKQSTAFQQASPSEKTGSNGACVGCRVKIKHSMLGKTSIKKNVFFRALRELPDPPPSPQFGQLGPLFSDVKIQDLKVSLELKILYILYDILYICNLKNS